MSSTLRSLLLGGLLAAAPLSARAVVVWGGDGTQNSTAPANDFGFASVGQCFSPIDGFFESCVYLEGNWVISAYHTVRGSSPETFSLGEVIFEDPTSGPVSFAPVPGSGVRLRNADNSFTDLALFQLTAVPTFLDETVISAQSPAAGSSVILAGNGISREPALTRWDVNSGVWTEEVQGGADEQGYKLIAAPSEVRWGTNTLENTGNVVFPQTTRNINAGYGNVTVVQTNLDEISGQAQGVAGDSGGGVFYERAGNWELLGVIVTRDYKTGQPEFSAVSGNNTYAAHLPTYRNQILSVIPEPSSAGLLIVGGASLLLRRRRAS